MLNSYFRAMANPELTKTNGEKHIFKHSNNSCLILFQINLINFYNSSYAKQSCLVKCKIAKKPKKKVN